jgi:aminobenzoyl-glutamate transport protein
MKGLVTLITLLFFIPGYVFGKVTGTIKDTKDMVKVLGQSMADMGPYVTLSFIIAQFTGFFTWSNMGLIFAIKGANALQASGFPIPVVIVLIVIMTILIDIFLGSSSAKWAIFAPIFVPMFMFMGYHPTFIQQVYRTGDAIINVITPLIPYYGMMLAFGRKYDKDLKLGTLIATMFPYSMWYAIVWVVMLLIWYFFKIPFGPGGPMMLP